MSSLIKHLYVTKAQKDCCAKAWRCPSKIPPNSEAHCPNVWGPGQ